MMLKRYLMYAIFFYLIIGATFLTINYQWGYDEYGSVVSHIELDDKSFVSVYRDFLYSKGFSDGLFLDFILNVFLPIFIVPLRWTYAIGISPLFGVARVLELDWSQLRIVLFTPFAFLSSIGLVLIYKSLLRMQLDRKNLLLFLLFLLSSPSFVHWSFTLSPYSFHVFCFGLILYIETHKGNLPKTLFGRLSILRSLPIFLNYQYIPIMAILGVFEMLTKKSFLKKDVFAWILPGIIALSSVVFLYLRSRLIGKHEDPAVSTMSAGEADKYSLLEGASSISEATSFLFSRMYDIFEYFYSTGQSQFFSSSYSHHQGFSVLLGVFLVVSLFFYIRHVNKGAYSFLIVYISAYMLMYLIDQVPMTPSRHALVLLPPFALAFAIVINESLFKSRSDKVYLSVVLTWFLVIFTYYLLAERSKSISMEKVGNILERHQVRSLIMAPCSIEPVLHLQIREKYDTFYRCGPRVVKRLPNSIDKVGLYSHGGVTLTAAKAFIGDYSEFKWNLVEVFDYNQELKGTKTNSKHNVLIFEKEL